MNLPFQCSVFSFVVRNYFISVIYKFFEGGFCFLKALSDFLILLCNLQDDGVILTSEVPCLLPIVGCCALFKVISEQIS